MKERDRRRESQDLRLGPVREDEEGGLVGVAAFTRAGCGCVC